MIDLDKIDPGTLLARGAYATIRAAHEDAKKSLQILCGKLSSVASQTLRHMQPDSDGVPDDIALLIAEGRATLDMIETECKNIVSLAQQRAGLKQQAWGGK